MPKSAVVIYYPIVHRDALPNPLTLHFLRFCRNLPRANVVGVLLVTVVYILTNISYLAVLSPAGLLDSDAVAVVRPSFSVNHFPLSIRQPFTPLNVEDNRVWSILNTYCWIPAKAHTLFYKTLCLFPGTQNYSIVEKV